MERRRGAIDAARVGSLILVVIGHLSMAVIDRGPDGALRGDNVLALYPSLAWLAMLAPMPVFFAAGGWANATSHLAVAAPRVRTLVGLGAVVVALWSIAALLERLITGDGGLLADGARIATQPLWFLAAYVPFAVLGSTLARGARRPLLAVGACLVALAVLDLARFAADLPAFVGWPGFYLAWVVPWLLGAWWRRRWEAGDLSERRLGAVLAVAGVVACAFLVGFAGYFPSLIDAVEGERSNTTPPTLFTAVAAITQVGVLMMIAGVLDAAAMRWRRLLDRAGEAAVGVYMWHLTALALCAGLLAAGLWTPTRFLWPWWVTRPLWFGLVLGVTLAFVRMTAVVRPVLDRPRPTTRVHAQLVGGVLAATAGAGVVGAFGPRQPVAAVAAATLFVGGWYLLGATSTPGVGKSRPTGIGRGG